jgi:nucleoside-diphosphate-sugar epimerase
LLAENVEIFLFQREKSAKRIYLPEHKNLHIEYCTLDELSSYKPKGTDYDVFFHLGWGDTNREGRNNIRLQYKNVKYACDAVELAKIMGCHTFIGAGSQAEYGRHNEPLRPDTLCTPETAYGAMKLSAGHATRIQCKRNGIRHIWPRILSGYGLFDTIDSVLSLAIRNSLDGKKIEFTAGEQIWDYTYLDDIGSAMYLMAKCGKDGSIYPIGSGRARPLKEYIRIMCEKLGYSGEEIGLGKIPYSENQIMHLEADSSNLMEDTGWQPQVDFEEGIVREIEYYKEWKVKWEKRFWERCK